MNPPTRRRIPPARSPQPNARLRWLRAQAVTLRRKLERVEAQLLALTGDPPPVLGSATRPRCCCTVHPASEPCCPGWLHMDDPRGIERCDDCQRFSSDDVAQALHDVRCGCGWGGEDEVAPMG